jgi:putative transposase
MGYPSDVTDSQWELIKDYFKFGNYGNRSTHSKRDLLNAVFYLTKTGCQWRQLPNDFPHWTAVETFYRRAKVKGIWEKIMTDLVKTSRVTAGRKPDPTYALIDSQSVKTTNKAEARGIDGGKKGKGA